MATERQTKKISLPGPVIVMVASSLLFFQFRGLATPPHSPVQQAFVKASNADSGDTFGRGVALWDDTVVVGADCEGSGATGVDGDMDDDGRKGAGAVYVFVRSGSTWSQQAYLKASNTDSDDRFGHAVAIWGDTIVVGAYRESSGATEVNGSQTDNSELDSGAVYVFVRQGTNWSQQAYLKASNADPFRWFGRSVAVWGDTIVVGALLERSRARGVNSDQHNENSRSFGAAYVFVRSGTTWSQQAYFKASNSDENDVFGTSVAICRDTVVVGASGEDSSASGVDGDQTDNSLTNSGAAYVFVRSGTVWSQQAYLKASNPDAFDMFGDSVAVWNDTVVVGARNEDSLATGVNRQAFDNSATNSGAAYVFVREGIGWSQQAYLKASNASNSDYFGSSVGVSGDFVLIAGEGEDSSASGVNGDQTDNSANSSGAAYAFVRQGTNWTQLAYLKASNPDAYDVFGVRVSIHGDAAVVGALFESSNATRVDGDQTDNSAPRAGACYIFGGLRPTHPEVRVERSENELRIFWPISATGFVLEEAETLEAWPSTGWTQVSFPYQTNDSCVFTTVPMAGHTRFYRLQSQELYPGKRDFSGTWRP